MLATSLKTASTAPLLVEYLTIFLMTPCAPARQGGPSVAQWGPERLSRREKTTGAQR